MPLEWHADEKKEEISNLQLNSMIGGDSYVFNTEKSIAKSLQTFLSCQVPSLATFVPLAWHGMRLEEFKIAIQ